MKLASYKAGTSTSYGIVTDGGIVDLASRLGPKYRDLASLLGGNGLALAARLLHATPDFNEREITYLPVIEQPHKIICVGMNYAAKRKEFEQTDPAPTLFIRFADSQTGHNCALLKPVESNEFDYEGELAIVIGKSGHAIAARNAYAHIAGYSCYMDGSVRDWQHTWFTAGKNWPATGSFGPWLVTRDEIPDPQNLGIRTYLNGREVQNDSTANMIHRIPELIEYISTFSALSPGDVIITGSPGGVGKKRRPPLFLQVGDVVEVEIEKIGRLHNVVMQKEAAA